MSDWGATHSISVEAGLDQEMPFGQFLGDPLRESVKNGSVSIDSVNNSVLRILTPMFRVGLSTYCLPFTIY